MKSPFQTISDGRSIRVDTEAVQFYLPVDNVDEKDLSKNRYSIAFVMNGKHEALWTYCSRDERDKALKQLDGVVFAVTDLSTMPIIPEVVS